MYCTGGVRRRCYDECEEGAINTHTHTYYMKEGIRIARVECEDGAMLYMTSLQTIEKECACVIHVYV